MIELNERGDLVEHIEKPSVMRSQTGYVNRVILYAEELAEAGLAVVPVEPTKTKGRPTMNKTIPILDHYSPDAETIGSAEFVDGRLVLKLRDDTRITRDMLFNVFGNARVRVLKGAVHEDGLETVLEAEIVCWAVYPLVNEETDDG